jgi:RNA polymerase-binding transcription factor DksA
METELADGENQVEGAGPDAELAESPDPTAQADMAEVEPGSSSDLSIDEVDRLLDEVEGALSRLDDGTYGTCAACGGPIDDAFLAGSPTTRTCEACTSPADTPSPPSTGSDS